MRQMAYENIEYIFLQIGDSDQMQAHAQPTLRRQPRWVEDPNIWAVPKQYASDISTTLIDTQIMNMYIAIGSDLIVIFWLNVDEVLSLLVLVLSSYTWYYEVF